jgi:hypothetical protein
MVDGFGTGYHQASDKSANLWRSIDMDTGQQALVLFYAFFWAAALSVTSRYQPFDTPSMSIGDGRAWRRFIISLIVLNVLPVIWFIFLYLAIIPNKTGWVPIVAAAIASLSVFGYHRILHAFIASERMYHWFYTVEQVRDVRDRGQFTQPQTFRAHFVPGVLYIVSTAALAGLIINWS